MLDYLDKTPYSILFIFFGCLNCLTEIISLTSKKDKDEADSSREKIGINGPAMMA
jgi:hypothetical protein